MVNWTVVSADFDFKTLSVSEWEVKLKLVCLRACWGNGVLYIFRSNDNNIKNKKAGIQIIKLILSCGMMIR